MYKLLSKILDILVISIFVFFVTGLLNLLYCTFIEESSPDYNDYFKKPNENNVVKSSRYDYSLIAESITKDCITDYDKIKAIYLWLCNNIEYDTSYKIYHADECFDNKKGVCNAYSELFYYMAKSIGIDSEIVVGYTKDENGELKQPGHAWVFAYTRKNHGILLDPTWGAGYVSKDGKFIKNENSLHWFNVDPKWMILSHIPKDEKYQLLNRPVRVELFKSFQKIDELYLDYGLSVDRAYEAVIHNSLSLPDFFSSAIGHIEIVDIPQKHTLSIGDVYTFSIKVLDPNTEFSIINDNIWVKKDEWNSLGNGIYSIEFMPRNEGEVMLSIYNNTENLWHSFVKYNINEPSELNWRNVERVYSLSVPEAKNVKNLHPDNWDAIGISPQIMLNIIRKDNIKELPDLFVSKGQKLKVGVIPMNKYLNSSRMYSFDFYPKSGINWALINNDKWYKDWDINIDSMYTMKISPEQGKLGLYVQFEKNASYWCVLQYIVN